jgi:Tfp pilus assembly protein PilX
VTSIVADEKGIVLIAGIGLIAVLSLIGAMGIITTATEIKISSNYKTNAKALYAAQAGTEEARAQLRGSSSNANYAGDTVIDDSLWAAYILTSSASWEPTSDDPDYDVAYSHSVILHLTTRIILQRQTIACSRIYHIGSRSGIKGKLICYPMNHIQTMVLPAI